MNYLYQHYLLIILEQYTSNFGLYSHTFMLFLILPEIITFFSLVLLIIILGLFYNNNTKQFLFIAIQKTSYYALLMTLIALVIPLCLLLLNNDSEIWSSSYYVFQNTYTINAYTQTLKIIVILSLLVIYQYFDIFLNSKYILNAGELPLLIHISLFLIFIIISCSHFAILLLALEGFSLILYILTTIDRSHGGITASVKYFTFGTLGSILLFWGVAHYYAIFPNLLYKSILISHEYAILNNFDSLLASLNFAGISILLGFLIKLGAAPIHQWVPDVYAGSHLIITSIFATVVKVVIFIIFCCLAVTVETNAIVFLFAVCSLIIGSFITIRQVEIKRFLAYSSITHVGFLLIGDLPSSYIYLLTYTCSSLLFFSILLSLKVSNNELIYLNDLRLIKKSGLWNTALLIISLASMAGLPPFSGFFGKYLIWSSLIEDIYLYNNYSSFILLLVSVILTLITIFYYMRLIVYIYLSNDSELVPGVIVTSKHTITPIILVIIIVFWIFLQPKLMSLCIYMSYIIN